MGGWLNDLAGRTKDLVDEVNTADLVVMVATAGENAAAANLAGVAPEEDQDVVAAALRKAFGRPVTPLALGRQV